jgi:hypothetical protein
MKAPFEGEGQPPEQQGAEVAGPQGEEQKLIMRVIGAVSAYVRNFVRGRLEVLARVEREYAEVDSYYDMDDFERARRVVEFIHF